MEISCRLGYVRPVRLVAVALAALAGVAAAQKPREYARELQAGIDAFRLGKYDAAKQHLELAHNLDLRAAAPHRFLAAVAAAQLRFAECIDQARKALRLEPAASEAPETRKLHATCREKAERPAFAGELGDQAAIAVVSNPSGAAVKIRGLGFGGTPLAPRPIAPGQLVVEVSKSGFLGARVEIDAVPGIVTDVIVELTPGVEATEVVAPSSGTLIIKAAPAREVTIDGRVIKGERVELSPGVHVVEVREPGRDPWRRRVAISADREVRLAPELVDSSPRERKRTIGTLLTGGGVVVAGLAVGAYYVSRRAAGDARDILRIEIERPPGDTTPPIRTRADFEAARDKANRWATISNIVWATGLVAAGTGVFLLHTNRRRDGDVPAFALTPISGGAFASMEIRW